MWQCAKTIHTLAKLVRHLPLRCVSGGLASVLRPSGTPSVYTLAIIIITAGKNMQNYGASFPKGHLYT